MKFCRSVSELNVESLDLPKVLIKRVIKSYGSFENCLEWYRYALGFGWQNTCYGNDGRWNLLRAKKEQWVFASIKTLLNGGIIGLPISKKEYTNFYDLIKKLDTYHKLLIDVFEKNNFFRDDLSKQPMQNLLGFLEEEDDGSVLDCWHEAGLSHEIYENISIDEFEPLRILEKHKGIFSPQQYEILRTYFENNQFFKKLTDQEQKLFNVAKENFVEILKVHFRMLL